jgi:serine/threonine protein kinase
VYRTTQGRPYFVMEDVTGMPLTDYCDKHKLAMRQRLELFVSFVKECSDLKPSNILIGEVDGKATAQRLTAETMFTHAGRFQARRGT